MNEFQPLMFDFGPLHKDRHHIMEALKKLPLKTGDILFRASDAKGPMGLPFSKLVARLSKSDYSHAAILIMEGPETDGKIWPYVLEVNDQGTLKYRMVDWLDTCCTPDFSIYRLKNIDEATIAKLDSQIRKMLSEDAEYDFTFTDDNKFYCVESVAKIYENIGIKLIEPQCIKEIIPTWVYWTIWLTSPIFGWFDTKMPLDKKLYYVGNETQGMMSSNVIECVYQQSTVSRTSVSS